MRGLVAFAFRDKTHALGIIEFKIKPAISHWRSHFRAPAEIPEHISAERLEIRGLAPELSHNVSDTGGGALRIYLLHYALALDFLFLTVSNGMALSA